MDTINSISAATSPVVMSSEELKAILYLTIRGGVKLPGAEDKSTSREKEQSSQNTYSFTA